MIIHKKKGQLKILVSLLVLFILLFLSVFAVNQSLNQTNNYLQDNILNITPDVNISINVSIDIINITNTYTDEVNISESKSIEDNTAYDDNVTVIENTTNVAIPSEDVTLPPENFILTQTNFTENLSDTINASINEDILSNTTNETVEKPKLAEVVNGKSIDTPEIQQYIKWYNNFSSLNFEEVGNKTESSTAIKVGNFNHELKGFIVDNKKYAFELLACDEITRGCSFKVNGISTGKIYSSEIDKVPRTFSLNDEHEIKINSILFNFCGNKRFCDTYFEAYDLVEIEVVGR